MAKLPKHLLDLFKRLDALIGDRSRFRTVDGLLNAADLLAAEPPEWQIEGVFPSGGLAVLYGPPGSGKSFVALDWALSVASGLPWLGLQVQAGPVVYIAAEGGSGLGKRLEAWGLEHAPLPSDFQVHAGVVDFKDLEQVEKLRDQVGEIKPVLLVIDTMARCLPGADENSAQDVGAFVGTLDNLAQGVTKLVVHHTGKDGKEERGSSALRGAADTMLKLGKQKQGGRLLLACDKQKDAEEFDDLPLQLVPVMASCVVDLAESENAVAQGALQREVLDFVSNNEGCSRHAVESGVIGKATSVRAALDELLERGSLADRGDRIGSKLYAVFPVA